MVKDDESWMTEVQYAAGVTMYADPEGNPCSLRDCGVYRERYKRVALSTWASGMTVSTVYLGFNHSFRPGPPLIYETLPFGPDEDAESSFGGVPMAPAYDQFMRRYHTWEEATTGHLEVTHELADFGFGPPETIETWSYPD